MCMVDVKGHEKSINKPLLKEVTSAHIMPCYLKLASIARCSSVSESVFWWKTQVHGIHGWIVIVAEVRSQVHQIIWVQCLREGRVTVKMKTFAKPAKKCISTSLLSRKSCGWIDPLKPLQRSYKKLQPFVQDFSRTSFDFQGQPTRNVSHRFVHKIMSIPSPSLQTLRLELFATPVSLHFSVHLSKLIVNSRIKHKTHYANH